MIDMKDFEREDGSLDWKAYRHAQVEDGERCMGCGTYLVMNKDGKTRCFECKDMQGNPDKVSHSSLIRCPKCLNEWEPEDQEDYHVLQEGEHEVTCYECDHSFEVSTAVSFEFTSPEKENKDA